MANFFEGMKWGVSEARLESYRLPGDKDVDVLARYLWNIALSEALTPSLQNLEIGLRNALHNTLSDAYNTEFWFDVTPGCLHADEQQKVESAKQSLRNDSKVIEPGRVVAELTFGFWTSLLDARYEYNPQTSPAHWLWPRLLRSAFPDMPNSERKRNNLSRRLNPIRKIRNRVFHYEPIWRWGNLLEQYADILETVRWISPELYEMTMLLDRFSDVFLAGSNAFLDDIKRLA